MIKIGEKDEKAVLKPNEQQKVRKRSDSEEEVTLLMNQEHTEIADIDIRENSKQRLRFRKMPWCELSLMTVCGIASIAIYIYMNMNVGKERLGKL